MCGADDLGRVAIRLVIPLHDGLECLGLVTAGYQEQDMVSRVQQGWGKGQAIWWRLGRIRDVDHQTFLLVERVLVGEEGSSMSIWSHAKLDQVKGGDAAGTEGLLDLLRVCLGRRLTISSLARHAMNLVGGNGYMT